MPLPYIFEKIHLFFTASQLWRVAWRLQSIDQPRGWRDGWQGRIDAACDI
jgi:hypothetical protein